MFVYNTGMSADTEKIQCPDCGKVIPVAKTLRHQITESIRREHGEKIQEQKSALLKREQEVENERKQIQVTVQKQVASELKEQRKEMSERIKKQVQEDTALEMNDLKEHLASREWELHKARESELALRKRERELEERAKNTNLEVERKLAGEREKIESAYEKYHSVCFQCFSSEEEI